MNAPTQTLVERDDPARHAADDRSQFDAATVAARCFLFADVRSLSAPRSACTNQGDGDHDLLLDLPCRNEPELWFAEAPANLDRAKALCAGCPIRLACLAIAVDRAEYAGVWGGHIFDRGRIVPRKRPRGRPRKHNAVPASAAPPPPPQEYDMTTNATSTPERTSQRRVDTAAARLYDAECALHAAHQSHVDAWINAASQKLHDAVAGYLTAVVPSGPPPAP